VRKEKKTIHSHFSLSLNQYTHLNSNTVDTYSSICLKNITIENKTDVRVHHDGEESDRSTGTIHKKEYFNFFS